MPTPFFIAGSGRSGSTYLYHLLKAHPLVAISNEARVVDALWLAHQAVALPYGRHDPGTGLRGVVSAATKPHLEEVFLAHALRIMQDYYTRAFSHPFTHFGDKLPDHHAIGLIAHYHRHVRVLLMVRDPRDVVCSYLSFRQLGVASGPREQQMLAFSVAEFAIAWRACYEVLLRSVPVYCPVSYPELVLRPAQTMANVLRHLDLADHPAIAEAIRTNTSHRGHATSGTGGQTIGRWQRDLSPQDADTVVEICGPLMSRLGIAV